MHLPLKQSAFILPLLFGALLGAANAQTLTVPVQASTTGSSAVDFEFRADGTLIAKSLEGMTESGAGTGTLLSTDQGAGTRMLWFPAYGAFRAGFIDNNGTQWNQSNIGLASTALAWGTTASGMASFATGYYTVASGGFSFASGEYSVASGGGSAAFNGGTASGGASASFGGADSSTGTYGFSTGTYNTAGGWASMVTGHQNYSGGTASFAAGFNDWTQADYSAVFGYSNGVSSFDSFVVGRYAVGGGNGTAWQTTDPLLEVGNGTGTGSTPLADAMVVYKNGNMNVQGVLSTHSNMRCAAGGDLSMGSFTAGTAP